MDRVRVRVRLIIRVKVRVSQAWFAPSAHYAALKQTLHPDEQLT